MAETAPLPITRSIPVRLRGGRARSLQLALIILAVCALVLGVFQLAVEAQTPDAVWAVSLFTVLFWIWMTAGIIAWWRRPNNAIGALIVIGAITVFLGGLGNLGIPFLTVIGEISATAVLAVMVHLLHAFPSGRLRGRLSIATVFSGYVIAIGLQSLAYVASVADEPELAMIVSIAQRPLGLAVMVATAVILISRLIDADRIHRRVLLPLFAYGILAVVLISLTPNVLGPLGADEVTIGTIQLALNAGIPIAFLLGVLLGGFTRTGDLEALSAWLGIEGATRPAVARALSTTLGDNSLRVFYWAPERKGYVDEHGTDVDPATFPDHQGLLEVRVDTRLVGAIVYDTRIIGDPYPVRRAAEVLAIAVDRERLTAELIASNEALMQSRVRLVETADRERSRIARDLHDGLQVQLVLLALEAQKIANSPDASDATSAASAELRRGIDAAAADLRSLVHNVLPAALVEQGLIAATEDIVDRLAIPATLEAEPFDKPLAPATTHTAYFILAEVLTNAVKHSRATFVTVHLRRDGDILRLDIEDNGVGGARVSHGTGLRGLIDRVDVLGGSVVISSPRGGGTEVKVELPCA
ncbi:sensor histidine kinase [Microbacterium rhizomatis]|uniref:histidine kinase n=1 Tax=Microbacterium rhizomatis TaxID=1631477 RepID=A0A5J5J3V4_9MICO|nr:histidine kinase [Microbacterium rhizomatis]KAA9107918.1 ATPase [Microbacterium rhizomatis]